MGKSSKKRVGAKAPSKHARRLERCRSRPIKPVQPLFDAWTDPASFSEALRLHIQRHRESPHALWRAITEKGDKLEPSTIVTWRNGSKSPRTRDSFIYLQRIEARYGLVEGYFAQKLPHKSRATARPALKRLTSSEQRRLAWHLPNDFESRPRSEQDAILSWVQEKVISGATD